MKDTIEEARAFSADECAKMRIVAMNDARPATLINPVLRDYVTKLVDECERLRSELDARVAISPEDAAAMVGARIFTTETDAAERLAAALRAHAEKARKR